MLVDKRDKNGSAGGASLSELCAFDSGGTGVTGGPAYSNLVTRSERVE
jgi:hypothetical protein